jgi:hypothetical protein
VNNNRLHPGVFTERGIVAIGYAAFAFAVGVFAGAVIRRVLPALAATLLVYAAVRLAITAWIRPHLLPSSHVVLPTRGPAAGHRIPGSWTISSSYARTRMSFTVHQFQAFLRHACRLTGVADCRRLPKMHGRIEVRHFTYQPASHYWPLQIIETGIFVILAAGLVWFTVRWMTPRAPVAATVPTGRVLRLLPSASGSERAR